MWRDRGRWRSVGGPRTSTRPRRIRHRRRAEWRWCVWRCTAVCRWWSTGGCRGGRACTRTAPWWPYAIWTGARTAGTRARPRRRRSPRCRPRTRARGARGWWRTACGCTTCWARTATTAPSRASTRTVSNSCRARTNRPGTRSARRTLCATPSTTPCPPACPCPDAGACCTAATSPAGTAATPFWSGRICRPPSCTPVCAVPVDSHARTPRLKHAKNDAEHHKPRYNEKRGNVGYPKCGIIRCANTPHSPFFHYTYMLWFILININFQYFNTLSGPRPLCFITVKIWPISWHNDYFFFFFCLPEGNFKYPQL